VVPIKRGSEIGEEPSHNQVVSCTHIDMTETPLTSLCGPTSLDRDGML